MLQRGAQEIPGGGFLRRRGFPGVGGSAIAIKQRSDALDAGYQTETKRLLATSAQLSKDDPSVALLLAVEASRRRGQLDEAHDAMLQALMAVPASLGSVSIGHPLRSLVYDRTGRRVIGIGDTEAVIVDATSHRVLAR